MVILNKVEYSIDYDVKYYCYDQEEVCYILLINDKYAIGIAPTDDPTNIKIYPTVYSGYHLNKIEKHGKGKYSVKMLFVHDSQLRICKVTTSPIIDICIIKVLHCFKYYDKLIETKDGIYIIDGKCLYNFTTNQHIFNVESYEIVDGILEYTQSVPKNASDILKEIMKPV